VAAAFGVKHWTAPDEGAGAIAEGMLHVVQRADMNITLVENGTLVKRKQPLLEVDPR